MFGDRSTPVLQRIVLPTATALLAAAASLFTPSAQAQSFTLSVQWSGNGTGFITAPGNAIFCTPTGGTCSASFAAGTTVTLSQAVFEPAFFAGWAGCDTVTNMACDITLASDRMVTLSAKTAVASNEPVVSSMRSNDGFSCAVTAQGGVKCLGRNTSGQLGNNDPTHATQASPVDVVGLASGAIEVATGQEHACALLATGGVKCWGRGTAGQLGDGTNTNREAPVDVVGLSNVVQITAGLIHTCALNAAGNVKCWGQGGIGDNAGVARSAPVDVVNLPEIVTAIRGGNTFTCALTATGTMKCWGSNFDGQLGDGSNTTRNAPVAVLNLTNVATFATGANHTCAVTTAGAAHCWGLNFRGQLGDGTNTSRNVPTAIPTLTSGVTDIGTGADHSCAIVAGGAVKCWGFNNSRQLGDGTFTARNAPVDVVAYGGAGSLAIGMNHSCALGVAGRVACWGSWYLPNGNTTLLAQPTAFRTLGGIVSVGAGFNSSCVATTAGARCAGVSTGDGTSNARQRYVDVQELNTGTTQVVSGLQAACLLTGGGAVRCWGSGTALLGNGVLEDFSRLPVQATGLESGVTSIAMRNGHGCAVQGGVVKCWGVNDHGQLGTGAGGDPIATPSAIATPAGGFDQVVTGSRSTCGLRAGGVLCWGDNGFGQVGNGVSFGPDVLVPTAPIGLATNVVQLAAGDEFACALKDDGSVWCWGNNDRGQLGRGGPTATFATPAAVTGLAAAAQVTANGKHACARLATGTVKCWGANGDGQIGDGTTSTQRDPPVDVLNLGTDVQQVSAGGFYTCALTWGGLLRCWGSNVAGTFGTGDLASSLAPTAGVIGQSLAFTLPPAVATGAATPVSATASSGLAVTLTNLTPNCMLSGGNLTLDSGGRCGVVASQAGGANGFAAPSRNAVTTAAGLSAQAITFTNIMGRFSVETFTVTATGGGSGNPVTFSSQTPSVCASSGANGATITMQGLAGTCTLAASQAGGAAFLPAQSTASFAVTLLNVTISASKTGGGTGTIAGETIDCGSTCSMIVNGGTHVFTATPGVNSAFVSWSGCNSVSGNQCTVSISGFSNRFISARFDLANVPQAIAFNPDPLPDQGLANFQYFFSVTASSGLLVSIASLTPAVCEVQGNASQNKLLALVTAGTCTVQATQAGNATFAPAPTLTRSFQVTPRMFGLNLFTFGTGSGRLTGNALDCGANCSATLAEGTAIALTAVAAPGSQFVGWDSCPGPVGNRCNFALDFTRNVGAQFEPAAAAGPFEPGNLVVYRVGDGSSALAQTGNAVFLDEYRANGTIRQTIALPTAGSGAQAALVASGTATAEGLLTRSDSRNCLVLPGPGVIGVVSADGDADTTTALGDVAPGTGFRGAASPDCERLYGSGAVGVRTASIGATTSTDLTSTSVADTRGVVVVNGQLYVSGAVAGLHGVGTVGTGTPTTGPQAVTPFDGLSQANAPGALGFFLADLDGQPGVDTVYIADESEGIRKFSLIGGTWVLSGTVGAGADRYRGLTGVVGAFSQVTLYATRKANSATATPGGELVRIFDFNGFGPEPSGPIQVMAAADENTVFRGVALAPEVVVTPSAGPNATISPDTPIVVAGGATPSFTVGVDAGFTLVMGGTCGGMLAGTTYTINPALLNCTVIVTAAVPGFTVTPSADAHSSITPDAPQQAAPNAQLAFTVAADAGYSLTVGGTCGGMLAGSNYTTNGVTQDCTVTVTSTPADTTPDSFAFDDVTNVAPGATVTSNAIAVGGLTAPAAISVSGGSYSIGCTAAFTTAPGMVTDGATVCVRHDAPFALSAATGTTLTIGGVSDTFMSVTVAALPPAEDFDGDGVPNAVEAAESRNPFLKDNDIFANSRLFAMQQYRDFLGREGDAAGLDVWTNQTAAGVMTRAQVVEAFFDSAEFQDGLPQITRLYFAFFNRIADYPGLLFHTGRYRAGVPLNTIAEDFAGSQEFQLTYGSLTNGQYVDLVYQNVLGRPADPAGRANALAQLDGGVMTRGELMAAFSESQEHINLSGPEVFVTAIYVGMLRRSPDAIGLQNWVGAFEGGLPRTQMLQAFLDSQEYRNRFLP